MAGIQYLIWLSTRRGLSQRHQVELLDYFWGAERAYLPTGRPMSLWV